MNSQLTPANTTAYALGELTDAERAAFEQQMETDPALAALARETKAFCGMLDGSLRQPVPSLAEENRVTLLAAASKKRSKAVIWIPWLAGAAAACVAGGFYMQSRNNIATDEAELIARGGSSYASRTAEKQKADKAAAQFANALPPPPISIKPVMPKPLFAGTPLPEHNPPQNLDKSGRPVIEVKVPAGVALVSKGRPVTCSDPQPLGELSWVTDGDKNGDDGYFVDILPGKHWVQIDLGQSQEIHLVWMWHYHKVAAIYKDVVVQISDDPEFKTSATVFNNDWDNSAGFGIGRDQSWVETNNGRARPVPGVTGRYVRCWSNGRNIDDTNHYIEVEVYGRPPMAPNNAALAQADQQQREDLTRKAYEVEREGDALFAKQDFAAAVQKYRSALDTMPDTSATSPDRNRAAVKYGNASVIHARELGHRGEFEKAKALLTGVLDQKIAPNHPAAQKLLAQLGDPDRYNAATTEVAAANTAEVQRLLNKGLGYYDLGQFNEAEAMFNQSLAIDPYNTAARQQLERSQKEVTNYLTSARDETRLRMLNTVDSLWVTAASKPADVSATGDHTVTVRPAMPKPLFAGTPLPWGGVAAAAPPPQMSATPGAGGGFGGGRGTGRGAGIGAGWGPGGGESMGGFRRRETFPATESEAARRSYDFADTGGRAELSLIAEVQLEANILQLEGQLKVLNLKGEQLIAGAFEQGVQNGTIQKLYPEYQELVATRASLEKSGFGPDHPRIIGLKEAIRLKRAQLDGAAELHRQHVQAQLEHSKKMLEDARLHPAEAPGTESYKAILENPFFKVLSARVSTFSIDVDTASYSNVRRFLNMNQAPPPEAVRLEELVNYFPYDYAPPVDGKPFAVHVEMTSAPWDANHRVARIALKGKEIPQTERPAANLVFLVDVSGSMDSPLKLPLVKQSLKFVVERLTDKDTVSLVTYAGSSGVALPATNGAEKKRIMAAIEGLGAGGSTNGAGGITTAYDQAAAHFQKEGINRVILATDGDFNVGVTSHDALLNLITEKAKTKVFLSVLGYGMGNTKDDTMELLADKGNGNYAYIDGLSEARKALGEQFSGTLVTIAKDVKIQVEFNPAIIRSYRLLGYENRMLAKEDFNNDKKDAGEIGAGHTVTALYELVPVGAPEPAVVVDDLRYAPKPPAEPVPPAPAVPAEVSGETMIVKLRWKAPDADVSTLMDVTIKDDGKKISEASPETKWAVAVAGFAAMLNGSQHNGLTWESIRTLAKASKGADPNGYRGEFLQLLDRAESVSRK